MSRASVYRRCSSLLASAVRNTHEYNDEENDVDGAPMRLLNISSGDPPSNDNFEEECWIATTFKKKECTRYVEEKNEKCYCGRLRERHIDLHPQNATPTQSRPWDKHEDVNEFPNDSFGKIEFLTGSKEPSKVAHYVRLSNDTNPKDALNLLSKHWKLPTPSLAISVEGGTKNLKLSKHDQDTFSRGLANAAQTVGAWIISKGYNCGVHKAVGEAVREGQLMSWISNKGQERAPIHCIGITPWGYLENSQSLVGIKEKPAQYKVNPIVQRGKPVSLNPHHTHFLLIDDGTRTHDCEIPYRAKLEKAMKNQPDELDRSLGIPVVKICLEGGEGTIKSAKDAVLSKIPVVFCEGTGRAADLLALASKNCVIIDGVRKIEPSAQDEVYGRIHSVCRIRENDPKIQDLKKAIDVIMQHESMITVFSMDGGEQAGLDLAILKALLKGEAVPSESSQLELALSWGRVDVAKSIFEANNEWQPGSFDSFMTEALMNNRVDFIQLFLEQGANMKEYLTNRRLSDLYNEDKNNYVRKHLDDEQNSFTLHHVSSVIQSLTGAHNSPLYQMSTDDISMEFDHPFTELFLWATLGSRNDLAEFLWEHGEDQVCLAIVALRMFRSMSKEEKDPNDQLELLENSRKFEMLAISVIDECFDTNEELAQRMIEIPHNQWGGMNTLKIAADSKSEEFISRPCAQAVLNNIWMDGIQCSSWKAFLALIFPPLLLVIPYRKDFVPASIFDKGRMFYNAPVTKFYGGLITYLLLLLLFSYVLIFNFESRPSFWENILFGWICTFIIEEIRQIVIPNEFETRYKKIQQWMRSDWNLVDVAMLTLACVGYGLHWSSTKTESAEGWFCASCFLFYVRLLRIYAVHSRLGPKMVMIRKMMTELLYFLSILLVFMIGYGVASQSLLFPNHKNVVEAIIDVFYMPYFQILGELFLDVSVEGKLEDCSNNPADNLHPCPEKHPLVSILLVIYLLVGNVLLLNLLIAIFSFVFDEIQSKALQIWKYERYALVMEYADKPTLAAPFIVIEYIYMIIKWLYRKSCGNEHSANGPSDERNDELIFLEKVCAAKYRWKKANIESTEISEKVDRNEKSLKNC